jgi:hypothetical protein
MHLSVEAGVCVCTVCLYQLLLDIRLHFHGWSFLGEKL